MEKMDYNFMFSLYLILWHISIYIERNIINYLMGSSLVVALIQRPIIKEQKEKKNQKNHSDAFREEQIP